MIEIRMTGDEWRVVDPMQAEELLKKSRFVYDYDQIETSEDRFQILDFAIPAFLGAPPNFGDLRAQLALSEDPSRMQSMLDRLGELLEPLPVGVDLWDLNDGDLVAIENLYAEVCKLRGFGDARISKMLHRKRPQAIPIIDSRIGKCWPTTSRGGPRRMAAITRAMSEALSSRSAGREELRALAKGLGEPFSNLSDLRLYDVISYQLFEGGGS